ncbi:MAG: hypothetical protein ACOYK6_02080 [Chthoniobacterales bacterium]
MSKNDPLFSLENADLSTLLMPSWVKENSGSSVVSASVQSAEYRKNSTLPSRDPFPQARREGKSKSHGRNRGDNHPKTRSSFSKKDQHSSPPVIPKIPSFYGWKIEFLPEQRGLDEIAKQIKTESKAYPLFELARLLLEKPERYRLRCVKIPALTKNASKLYQCLLDESLWLSEKELITHVLKNYRDRYYLTETIEVEAPKGSYSSLAVCGMSQTILGPSNHHEYQAKVRQLHTERFSHLPLEAFKSRITMVHDEAMMEAWKKEQSIRETFLPQDVLDQSDTEKLKLTRDQLEAHFKKEHAASVIAEVKEELFLSGAAGMNLSSSSIKAAIQQALQELKRFPLPLSHLLGQELATRGLHIFKAHENIVYVSIARPRALNQQETPLSPALTALTHVLESHHKSPRAEQWKAMMESRPLKDGQTEAERESALAKDLSWLIHEGYVINYALRGFALAKKQKQPLPETGAVEVKS